MPIVIQNEIFRALLEQNELAQPDLPPIFKSRGYISEVLSGKRAISKRIAKALTRTFFGIGGIVHLTAAEPAYRRRQNRKRSFSALKFRDYDYETQNHLFYYSLDSVARSGSFCAEPRRGLAE